MPSTSARPSSRSTPLESGDARLRQGEHRDAGQRRWRVGVEAGHHVAPVVAQHARGPAPRLGSRLGRGSGLSSATLRRPFAAAGPPRPGASRSASSTSLSTRWTFSCSCSSRPPTRGRDHFGAVQGGPLQHAGRPDVPVRQQQHVGHDQPDVEQLVTDVGVVHVRAASLVDKSPQSVRVLEVHRFVDAYGSDDVEPAAVVGQSVERVHRRGRSLCAAARNRVPGTRTRLDRSRAAARASFLPMLVRRTKLRP